MDSRTANRPGAFARTLLALLVCAAFLAAGATQLFATFFRGNMIALMVLFFVCAVCPALIAFRFHARQPAPSPPRTRERGGRQNRSEPERARRTAPPAEAEAEREHGTVKWFDEGKGFGFVIRQNGDEIFVHHRSIRRHGRERVGLDDGQAVSFVAVQRKKGWQAEDVAAE